MKDYYKILGVDKSATPEEISAAYRKLALQYHPDRNKEPGSADKFKEIAEAFEVLNNPEKRKKIDNPTSGFGGFSFSSSPFDIFNTFFGMGQHRGVTIEQELELTFEEAALGCVKEFKIQNKERCNQCNGLGTETWKTCVSCAGTGRHIIRQSPFIMQTACPACRGEGRIPDKTCDVCGGKGATGLKEEMVQVQVPPGVFSGVRLTISGRGELDAQGRRGDLILALNVKEHPLFKRDGCDIIQEVCVPFTRMVLGGHVTVATLRGDAVVKIKAGTPDGARMRLAGQGVADISNPTLQGDMYVTLKVEVPKHPSQEYKELLNQLSKFEVEDVRK